MTIFNTIKEEIRKKNITMNEFSSMLNISRNALSEIFNREDCKYSVLVKMLHLLDMEFYFGDIDKNHRTLSLVKGLIEGHTEDLMSEIEIADDNDILTGKYLVKSDGDGILTWAVKIIGRVNDNYYLCGGHDVGSNKLIMFIFDIDFIRTHVILDKKLYNTRKKAWKA